ncbi:MAG: T9SS type A sorting domain-containing protein [Bacteroidales bacterium]|nr:T9SS type A sorting domain-containing protein [Bacteroidales bacterium]
MNLRNHVLTAFSALSMFCISLAAQNTMFVNGKDYVIDTIIPKHSVGPGTQYAFYKLPDRPMTIHVLEMDLTNPYVDMQVVNGGEAAIACETPSKMYARHDAPGHDMIAAHNGDFFTTSSTMYNKSGLSRMGLICDGEIVFNPVSQPLLYLTPDRIPYIDRVHFMSSVSHNGVTNTLNSLNMPCLEFNTATGANFLALYTEAWGSKVYEYYTGGKIAIIKPKNGETFNYASNTVITAVVESVGDNPGNPIIPAGGAILHGVGTSADFLGAMTAGDEIAINIRTSTNGFPDHIDIDEAIGGSGHIILQNGEITNIGNPECHPRTFMGISKDRKTIYSVVIDGRTAASAGITLDDQGYVLKALGAWDGVNLDGGGSSCMYINGEIKNNTSDGTERAVGNGVIFFSTAPVDDNFATLAFEPRAYKVPVTATFRPIVYAYNQYGLLKSKDVVDAVVTCDPEIGTMKNGVFTAVNTKASGYIYAEYNGLTTKQLVTTVDSEVKLVINDYIVDNRKGYPIQMNSTIGNFTYEVSAASVDWVSSDESIAKVVDGEVFGYKNGNVTLTGKSDIFTDAVNITVEIPEESSQELIGEFNASDWSLKQGGGKNLTITQNGTGFNLNYIGTSGRSKYITAAKEMKTYSLPYGVQIDINPGEADITKMQLSIADKIGNRGNLIIADKQIPKNTTTSYIIPFSNVEGVDIYNNAIYPITISNIRMDMGSVTANAEYEIQVPCFVQLYGSSLGVESIGNDVMNKAKLYPNPVEMGAPVIVECEGDSKIEIYNVNGTLVQVAEVTGTASISTATFAKGIYIVRVIGTDSLAMGKLIVK